MGNDKKDWVEVFQCGTDYEADLVYAVLQDAGIASVILNQRDHAFNLIYGYLANVKVMVPRSVEKEALELLSSQSISEEELTRVALKKK